MAVPEQWEISYAGAAELLSWDGETSIGTLACSGYTPYDGEIAPEDEYKSIYTDLRLSSFQVWDPYTPLRQLDYGETGRMEVEYKDTAWAEAHPGSAQRRRRGVLFSPSPRGAVENSRAWIPARPCPGNPMAACPDSGLLRLFRIFRRPLWKIRRLGGTLIIRNQGFERR